MKKTYLILVALLLILSASCSEEEQLGISLSKEKSEFLDFTENVTNFWDLSSKNAETAMRAFGRMDVENKSDGRLVLRTKRPAEVSVSPEVYKWVLLRIG